MIMRKLGKQSIHIITILIVTAVFLFTVYWAFSSWTEDIYFNLNPQVLPFYFVASTLVFFIVLYDDQIFGLGNKIGIVIAHSFLTRIISIILFYPGSSGDPWYHLAVSRTWYNTGMHYFSFLPAIFREQVTEVQTVIGRIYVYQRAATQHSLVVVLSRMLSVDVFWVHLCLVGTIWSLFIPLIAFKTAKALGVSNRTGLLAAVLMANAPILLGWSFIEVPNTLGFVFFAATIYFSVKLLTSNAKRKYGFLAFGSSIVSLLTHSMTGFVAIAMLSLALALMTYNSNKNRAKKTAIVTLLMGFAVSTMLLPTTAIALQLIYPIKSTLSLSKFLSLSVYKIILANFSDYTFIQGITYGTLSLLAIIGIASKIENDKGKRVKTFLALAFASLIAQYRIFLYFVSPSPFGEHRLLVFVPFAIAPLAAVAINRLLKWFTSPATTPLPRSKNTSKRTNKNGFTLRQGLAILLIGIGLSAFSAQAALSAWEGIAARGAISIVSVYSMEAAKLIHEEYLRTGERYVVVSDQVTEMAGIGLVGRYNPNEYFMLSIGGHKNKILYTEATRDISIEPMFTAATYNNATVTYLVTAEWSVKRILGQRIDYEAIVEQLSRLYETFAVLGVGEGQIHIFRFIVPYKPYEGTGPTLTVFMDTQKNHLNTSYTYKTPTKVTYTLNLTGVSTYNITDWPLIWSYESIDPYPINASIDANTWINFTASPDTSYTIKWTANEIYPNVIWKDDSFKEGWYYYSGRATYSFTTDGDIIRISAQGISQDYVIHDKQLPFLNGSLTLFLRIRVEEGTICYISLWDDTIEKEQVFFSYAIKTEDEYRTIQYSLPEDKTFTRIRLIVRTPDGSPSPIHLDYIMFIQI